MKTLFWLVFNVYECLVQMEHTKTIVVHVKKKKEKKEKKKGGRSEAYPPEFEMRF